MSSKFQPHSKNPEFDRDVYANAWFAWYGHSTKATTQDDQEARRAAGRACMARCIELADNPADALDMFNAAMAAAESDA